jgi:hypothetical protein
LARRSARLLEALAILRIDQVAKRGQPRSLAFVLSREQRT